MAATRSAAFDAPEFDLRAGIVETARALGMTPLDLATLIHYESGFDPNVWGGAGGRHYGSIQFGPTEREQYGVRVGDPSSQFGPEGAIVKYMLDRGFKPGMGIMDAYSTINAGRPGLYNASDEANGGQPNDVRDKVTNQMVDDREAAMKFLNMSAGTEDPRLDTPSSGRPIGSELPGQPASPYTIKPMSYDTYRNGPDNPLMVKDINAKDKYQKAAGQMFSGFGASGAPASGGGLGQMPAQAPVPGQAMPIVAPGGGEDSRNAMAMMMARLNSGKLWV